MKKIIAISMAAGIFAIAPLAHAQFGNLLSGAKSLTGSGSSGSGAELGSQQDQLVRSFVAANKDVDSSNVHMADALGIKLQVINAEATSDALTAKQIDENSKAVSANTATVAEALKSGATLKDTEAKVKYAKGLLSLATGIKKYMDMGKDAQGFTSSLTSVSPLQLGKLESGIYVAKNVPTSLTTLTSVLKSAVDFAKSNGVEIPKDATSLL